MPRSLKALSVSTLSSLVAVVACTIAVGLRPVVWAMWGSWIVITVTTVTLLISDRRQRAGLAS
ncbi:hypothetical protein [Streptomyces sp. Go-475]|uniref:hypothetical protein n=1 Tax=Streptomyces sp. Go-475 TaxID=2072505 RepID=UPI000DF05E65|nr:hypothetical protein [Streptomyces sp. Go-475]AXE88959.1 hypothetical protein C1703_28495 [Streptomyces sp. Go-475]